MWAYKMHWVHTSGDFPVQAEARIDRDFKQFRKPAVGGKRNESLRHRIGDQKVRFAGKCTLLAQAIGIDGKPVD